MLTEMNDVEACPGCEGYSTVKCAACNGMGSEFGDDQCAECEGTGWASCPDCGGEGMVPVGASSETGMLNTLPVKNEGHSFDKFMDDIVIKEGTPRTKLISNHDSPQRERARKHQERPLGRIRYGVK